MKKLSVFLMTGILAGMSFIGCDLLGPSDEDADEVTITLTKFTSIESGSYQQIEATVDANVEITAVNISITKDGAEVDEDLIEVEKPNTPTGEKKLELKSGGDMDVKVKVSTDACNGDYVFTITAIAGTAQSTKTNDFTITDGNDCTGTAITTKTLEAGANQNSSLGSSIDLDGGTVWKMADAASHVSEIDICYSHTATSGDKVGSASWAKASNYDYAKNWSSPPDAKMHKVSISSSTFDGITTAEEIQDLWVSADGESSLTVTQGNIFIVKTTEGAYALVEVSEQVAGETGSITIKVAK